MTHINPFSHLQRNADANPRGVFFRSAEQAVTNAEAVVLAQQLAFELRRLGVRAGDIVAMELPDRVAVLVTEAIWHDGGIPTVLPAGYDPTGVVDVRWLLTSRDDPAVVAGSATLVPVDAAFLRRVQENPHGNRPSDQSPDAVWIAFSSGTTGTPRAIPLSRRAMQSFDDALETWFQGDPFLVLMDFATPWGFGGFWLSVLGDRPYLGVGGADQAALVELAERAAVTSLKGSPAQISALVAELEARGRTLPRVETVFVGGTVMPPGVADRTRAAMGGCEIFSMYGSTEATIATSRRYESDDPSDAGTVLPGSTIEIVDDDDRVVPVGTPGRVRHRSAGMVHAYLGDPEASERAFRDGWFYSGDLGMLRPDGGLTLTGRETEVLNAGGVKIDPVRLDHAAMGVAGIRDACAFEAVSPSGLQQIALAVVSDDGADLSALASTLRDAFGSAAPAIVARVGEIPRNAMGKPMRRTLAARFAEA